MKKHVFPLAICLSLLTASVIADTVKPSTEAPKPPDKEKVSYALGMNIALQHKAGNLKVDMGPFLQALRDVMEGKPPQLNESEATAALNSGRATFNNGVPAAAEPAEVDNQKRSYAIGMRMASMLKRDNANVNMDTLEDGVRDELEGKPTRLKQQELEPILAEAQAYGQNLRAKKNKTEGAAFLAQNAKKPGVKVLPDGLQYKVIASGKGPKPTESDLILLKFSAKFADGIQFNHSDHFLTQINTGLLGLKEALHMMRVGDHFDLAVPAELAYGDEGEPIFGVGPNAVIRYDLTLSEILKPGDPRIGTGSVGHGLDGEDPEVFNR
ncbi:MAG TPA: FKBP-type peptidyl-prolyl cis-trans isomerase N-terminal domain-containing protein [Verrucomicrobiae bacterium]|nr:FKBP-type peptidyl-prolyl cis-trans isomerase N-terminal domain-containing protein [Verrucomicrobiae bacterium]